MATIVTSETLEDSKSKSSWSRKSTKQEGQKVNEPRLSTPKGIQEYSNQILEKERLAQVQHLVEQYQDCKELVPEPWTNRDTRFPNLVMYPNQRKSVTIPFVVLECSQENFSIKSPILMEHMFDKDLVMAKLREEGLNNLYDNLDI